MIDWRGGNMEIFNSPFFGMIASALAMLFTTKLNSFFDLTDLQFESVFKVIFPLLIISFILFAISAALQIKIDIEENKK
jgi:hypothetical protein